MSGSPVTAISGTLYVVGIHTYTVKGTPQNYVADGYNGYNKAAIIISEIKTYLTNA